MRRFIALSLLVLIFFNTVGYYALLKYELATTRHVEIAGLPKEAFDIIKLPASLYSHLEDSQFEIIDEEFSVGEKTYNSVKQRVINDTLEIYCLRNFKKEALQQLANALSIENSSGKLNFPATKSLIKAAFKDYLLNLPPDVVRQSVLVVTQTNTTLTARNTSILPNPFLAIHAPPPDVVA